MTKANPSRSSRRIPLPATPQATLGPSEYSLDPLEFLHRQKYYFENGDGIWRLDTTIDVTWLHECHPEGTRGSFGTYSVPKCWIEKE